MEREQFLKQVNDIGVSLIGQTGNITPADKKLYALRDVTATVESIPLIVSSETFGFARNFFYVGVPSEARII